MTSSGEDMVTYESLHLFFVLFFHWWFNPPEYAVISCTACTSLVCLTRSWENGKAMHSKDYNFSMWHFLLIGSTMTFNDNFTTFCHEPVFVGTASLQLSFFISRVGPFLSIRNRHPKRTFNFLARPSDYCLRRQCHVSEWVWIIKIAKKMNGGQANRSLPLNHSRGP